MQNREEIENFKQYYLYGGKCFNVEKARADKIYGNDKLNPVILAVGAGIGADFDITKIRYGKVI